MYSEKIKFLAQNKNPEVIVCIIPDALHEKISTQRMDEEEQVEEEIKTQPTVKSVETSVEDNYPEDIEEVEDDEYYYEEDDDSYYEPQKPQPKQKNVKVKPAAFASFDAPHKRSGDMPENIDLIKDVLLKVTVELGRTTKPIDDILQFTPGSILELDRLVGEPLDIMVNGKKIAKGEVVVIDENYGIRITDIIKSEKRLRSI